MLKISDLSVLGDVINYLGQENRTIGVFLYLKSK